MSRFPSLLAAVQHDLDERPLPIRWMILVGASFGVLGGLVGFILGLHAYPPTAWFAILEVGVPSGLLGGLLGLAAGTVAVGLRPRH